MTQDHQALIEKLGAGLAPVRRLLPPWQRTAGWLLPVVLLAALLSWHYGTTPMLRRWAITPDLAWAGIGAAMTAIGAAWAAFALAVPGRRAAWVWLAVPGTVLWIGASGLGCLRDWIAPGTELAGPAQSAHCLMFILGFSLPLSILLIALLRRACPLRPMRTAIMAGLASAAASAFLLEICHPYDAAATDLLTHALAVTLVIGINAAMGGRLLTRG